MVLTISHPRELGKYIAPKGSVAVDGVSLTVIKHEACSMKHEKCPAKRDSAHVPCCVFHVSLVNYTLRHTTLGKKKVGDCVNIEIDVLARYATS